VLEYQKKTSSLKYILWYFDIAVFEFRIWNAQDQI